MSETMSEEARRLLELVQQTNEANGLDDTTSPFDGLNEDATATDAGHADAGAEGEGEHPTDDTGHADYSDYTTTIANLMRLADDRDRATAESGDGNEAIARYQAELGYLFKWLARQSGPDAVETYRGALAGHGKVMTAASFDSRYKDAKKARADEGADGLLRKERSADGRIRLNLNNDMEGREQLYRLFAERKVTGLYMFGGLPTVVANIDGQPVTRILNMYGMRSFLSDNVWTYEVVQSNEGVAFERRVAFGRDDCATILAKHDLDIPRLEAVTTIPVMRPDGSILTAPGYDDTTGLYYAPVHDVPAVPERPTAADVEAATELLFGDTLADFPWVSASDRAHIVAAILDLFLKIYLPGPRPLFNVSAAEKGTGKTKLVKFVGAFGGIDMIQYSEDDSELRKLITASLLDSTSPVQMFDNVRTGSSMDSPVLSALLSADVWSDRVLGESRKVRIPNNRTWFATGNNVSAGGDNDRRTLDVRLDAGMQNPDARTEFRLPDLDGFIRDNIGHLTAAALTIIRSWHQAGARTVTKGTALGDFSRWTAMIAGVLAHIGVDGFMADRAQIRAELSDDDLAWSQLFRHWYGKHGSTPLTPGEIAAMDTMLTPFDALRRDDKTMSGPKIGWALKKVAGRWLNGLRVVRTIDKARNAAVWHLEAPVDTRASEERPAPTAACIYPQCAPGACTTGDTCPNGNGRPTD